MTRILVAVDFSPCGQAALEAAVKLAIDLKASLTLVHAFPPHLHVSAYAGLGYEELFERYAAEHETQEAIELTTEWAAKARTEGLQVTTHAEAGKPADIVLKAAEDEEVGFLVVGTHGNTGLRRVLMGSTAEEIVRGSKKPVLVVPFKA